MSKTGLILFHGFFEHKERHRLNKEWFEKLGIESHLIDLPGHGENALIKEILVLGKRLIVYYKPLLKKLSIVKQKFYLVTLLVGKLHCILY